MTSLQLEYRPAVVEDLLQVHAYLNREVSLELADRFLIAVEQATRQIMRFPHAGSLFPSRRLRTIEIRRWRVLEFPRYSVYYAAGSRSVTLLRVIHSARDLYHQPGI